MKNVNELTWKDIEANFYPSTAKALETANIQPAEVMILDYFGNLNNIDRIGVKKVEEIRTALAKIEFEKSDLIRSIGIHEIIYAVLIGKKDATIPGGYLKEIYSWEKTQGFISDILEDLLDEQEMKLMVLFFGLTEDGIQLSLGECGDKLGMTKDEVREIIVCACGKLRTAYCRENILDWCKNYHLGFKDYSGELKFDSVGKTLLDRMEIERIGVRDMVAKKLTETLEYIEEHDWEEVKAHTIMHWGHGFIYNYAQFYLPNWFRGLSKNAAMQYLLRSIFGEKPRYDDLSSFYTYPEAQIQSFIDNILTTLAPREMAVILYRFGLEDGHHHLLEECGRFFGISREGVRQIEAKALRKLWHPARGVRKWQEDNMPEAAKDQMKKHLFSRKVDLERLIDKIENLSNLEDVRKSREIERIVSALDMSCCYERLEQVARKELNETNRQLGKLCPKLSIPQETKLASSSPIEDLELSIRSFNCLKRYGCDTIADVVALSDDELSKVRNLGRRGIEEIQMIIRPFKENLNT